MSALKLLTGEDALDRRWFNWTGLNGSGNPPFAINRLEILTFEDKCSFASPSNPVAKWVRNACKQYRCMLIMSDEDKIHISEITGIDEAVEFHRISRQPWIHSPEQHLMLRQLLREPEDFFRVGWSDLRGGGGFSTTEHADPEQWLRYGEGVQAWARPTEIGNKLEASCPVFTSWRWSNYLDPEKLSFEGCFGESRVWTHAEVPNLKDRFGFVRFHWMRQMPCCGVGVRANGELVPFGALTDEKDALGDWIWDDGSIRRNLARQPFATTAEQPRHKEQFFRKMEQIVMLNPFIAGYDKQLVPTAGTHLYILDNDVFKFDRQLRLINSNAAPLKLSLTQMIAERIVPHERPFLLITSVYLVSDDPVTYNIGIQVNGEAPTEWKSAFNKKGVVLRMNVRASDNISYVLRRET